ncbi:MAG: sugar transferase [Clostridia bacterium]|nr:sugar transferase [Clostridia bacterium]
MLRKTIAGIVLFLGLLFIDAIILTFTFFNLYLYRINKELNLPFSATDIFDLSSLAVMPNFDPYLKMYFFLVGITLLFLVHFRAYWVVKREASLDKFIKVFEAVSYATIIAMGTTFAFKIPFFSRFVFFAYWSGAILTLWIWRMVVRYIVTVLTRRGYFTKRLLIIGAGRMGQRVIDELSGKPALGYEIVGLIDDDPQKKDWTYQGVPVLGRNEEVEQLVNSHNIEELLITIPSERNLISQIIAKTRRYNVQIRVIPEMYDVILGGVEVGQLGPIPYMEMLKTPMRGWQVAVKRVIDIVASALGLVLLAPLFALVAVAIMVDNPGPVIFKQKRVGKNGRIFDFYKFRSMVVNAEELREELAAANEADGPVFKIKHDPRVTRVGAFIRKYSIDELPQLFNVLKGDMSLVGPRPPLTSEVEEYGDWEWRRLEVTPGLTCIWQVSGRSNISFDKWIELDIYYIENWSLWLDIRILLQTIPVVLTGKGAY